MSRTGQASVDRCEECGARGPALEPTVVGGDRKVLCAECNPYKLSSHHSGDETLGVRYGNDDGPVADGGADVDEETIDEIEDLLLLQTRRRGRGHWSFNVGDIEPFVDGLGAGAIRTALRTLADRDDVLVSLEQQLGTDENWVARPQNGGV